MNKVNSAPQGPGIGTYLAKPAVGTFFAVASGLSFLGLLIVLPLVGQAGAVVPYAGKNIMAFLAILFATLFLSLCAFWSKRLRRQIDQSPFPYTSFGLIVVCLLFLASFSLGLLKI